MICDAYCADWRVAAFAVMLALICVNLALKGGSGIANEGEVL